MRENDAYFKEPRNQCPVIFHLQDRYASRETAEGIKTPVNLHSFRNYFLILVS